MLGWAELAAGWVGWAGWAGLGWLGWLAGWAGWAGLAGGWTSRIQDFKNSRYEMAAILNS